MSFTVCIPDLIDNGTIPKSRADEISRRYARSLAEFEAKGMDRATAETMATTQTLDILKRDAARKKFNSLKQVQKQVEWLDDMKAASGDGAINIKAAQDKYVSLDKKINALRGRYFSTLEDFLAKHRRNLLGELRNKDDLELTGREIFGEDTGDLNAREIADAVREVFEVARTRFNAAGGDIGKLDSYGLPQRHDARIIRQAGYDAWRAHPSVENVQIRDLDSGDWAVGAKRESLLTEIYETLRSEGANKFNPGQAFVGAMANRRGDPRILHFSGFDDWIAYQKDFGGGADIYDSIVGHLGVMARDTAIMEEMGPNPSATALFQQDWIKKSAQMHGTETDINKMGKRQSSLKNMFDELTGGNRIPDNRNLALGFSAFRAVQVSSKLGSAVLSAIPDFASLIFNAGFNGLPVMKTVSRYAGLWGTGGKEQMQMAVRLGLVTDDWINLSSSSARYTGEELTGEVSRRLAEFVIRSQGLARHTRNGQWAFGMEYISSLTGMAERSFGNLEPAMQRAMQRHGIGELDWDNYRATPMKTERGSDWIMPLDNKDVGEKFLQMVLTETDYAVLVPDLRTRTMLNSGKMQSGDLLGEILKTVVLFKAFPLSIINLHGRRMMEQTGMSGKLAYGLPLMMMMVAGGALSAQLKLIAAGKDPQPMDNAKFLGKAVMQSGSLGLFGDLLFNAENSFGGGLTMSLLGPGSQLLNNLFDANIANIGRAAGVFDAPDNFNLGRELIKDNAMTIEKEMPLRNLWYTRLAWERIITDGIREATDPNYADAYKRMAKRAANEGTEYFAPPGTGLSNIRAPDLANAFEGEMPQ